MEDAHPRLPRRAPQLSADQTRRAAAWMRPVDRQARDGLSGNFRRKRGAQGTAIAARHSGVLSFGFFSLDKQRKETRPWVREPTFKQLAAGAQEQFLMPLGQRRLLVVQGAFGNLFEGGVSLGTSVCLALAGGFAVQTGFPADLSPPRDEVLLFRQKYPKPFAPIRCPSGSLRFSEKSGVGRRAIHRPLPTRGIPAAPLRAFPLFSCDARQRISRRTARSAANR